MARHSFNPLCMAHRSSCVADPIRPRSASTTSELPFVACTTTSSHRRSHSFKRQPIGPTVSTLTRYALTVLICIIFLSPGVVSALPWVGSDAVQQRTLRSDTHTHTPLSIDTAIVEPGHPSQALVEHASYADVRRHALPRTDRSDTPPSRVQRSTKSSTASSSGSTTTSGTPTPSSPSPTAPPWTMPRAFDTDVGTNFTTDSCAAFFDAFLSNTTITSCHAVSMLLENSNSFFHSLTSAVSISRTLDAACAVSEADCTTIMTQLASNLLHDDDACGQDFRLGNPLVHSAYVSMVAYEPLYRATCLISPDTADYCFVDAALNGSSNLGDYDVYLVPLGTPLTSTDHPTCNKCLQATMTIYSQWATKNGQPLADTYLPSARQVDRTCGAEFANTNITVGSAQATSAAAGRPSVQVQLLASSPVGVTLVGLGLGLSLGLG